MQAPPQTTSARGKWAKTSHGTRQDVPPYVGTRDHTCYTHVFSRTSTSFSSLMMSSSTWWCHHPSQVEPILIRSKPWPNWVGLTWFGMAGPIELVLGWWVGKNRLGPIKEIYGPIWFVLWAMFWFIGRVLVHGPSHKQFLLFGVQLGSIWIWTSKFMMPTDVQKFD